MASSAPGPGLDRQGAGLVWFGGGAVELTVALGPLCPRHTQPRYRFASQGDEGTRGSAVALHPPTTAQAGAQASLRPQASSLPVAPPGVWDAKESEGSKLPGRVGSDLSKQQCCPGPPQYWPRTLAGSGPRQASLGLQGPRDI